MPIWFGMDSLNMNVSHLLEKFSALITILLSSFQQQQTPTITLQIPFKIVQKYLRDFVWDEFFQM